VTFIYDPVADIAHDPVRHISVKHNGSWKRPDFREEVVARLLFIHENWQADIPIGGEAVGTHREASITPDGLSHHNVTYDPDCNTILWHGGHPSIYTHREKLPIDFDEIVEAGAVALFSQDGRYPGTVHFKPIRKKRKMANAPNN